ncbi:MAG: hypothetical protein FWD35_01155, partial [Oscillospiraceae bacterium]|nr:hypothetical protein [Oscillospiraceae bacterium]
TLKLTARYTYKNRISLVSSVFFGIAALFVTFWFYDVISAHTLSLDIRVIAIVCSVMTALMGTDIVLQIHRYIGIREFLKKLSPERLQEALLKNMLRMGGRQQIREFRGMIYDKTKAAVEKLQLSIKDEGDENDFDSSEEQ